jgi:hypothetical protein
MIYQDTWSNGELKKSGLRECSSRYDIIRNYCLDHPPKSVLDIGANMCYFGLRLIEDFKCSVMAFEFDHFDLRKANVAANRTNKLMLLNRKISMDDLSILGRCCKFDLVLVLSVLHHCQGDTQEWIENIRECGKRIIIEFALKDSKRTDFRKNYFIPKDATILGYGKSHLSGNIKRPIILLKGR